MKRKIFALTCATLLVGAGGARAQDQAYPHYYGDEAPADTNTEIVGDDVDYVGDYGDFETPVVRTGAYVGDFDSVGDWEVGDAASVLPEAVPDVEADSHSIAPQPLANDYASVHCEPVVTGPMYQAICKPAPRKWLRAESLLWFLDERDTPPLVVVGPNRDNEFGDPITSGLAPGFRFDYGHYFNDNIGVGVRVWGLLGENEDYDIAGTGGLIVERPFFDTTRPGGPDFNGLIVSGLGGATGTFNAESEFDMIASEVYGRLKFGETKDYRIDLLGGYSYFGIDDSLILESNSFLGNQFTYRDSYDAENRFYGGQLGVETVINKGRWSFTSLTKVHLGNMNQRVAIDGFSRDRILPFPPGPEFIADRNGLYVQGQEGVYEEDVFTFVPEVNFRLGYSPRSQVHLTLGYTFVYWSSVAMAGEQINPVVDGVNAAFFFNTPGSQAAGYEIVNDGFWMQGLDLGVTFTF